jgi:putative ABC transport system substrate-binding protein
LISAAHPAYESTIRNLTEAARGLGLHLQVVEVRSMDELDSAFAAMTRAHAGALLVLVDTIFSEHRSRLAELVAMSRLPTMHQGRALMEAGGLISYWPSVSDGWRRGATYVDKILKGAKPADLPVEQPTKFELIINLKTAEALGLTIPPTLLFQADEVIR